ncbi:MAG: hypothetical protein ACJ70X_06510 [Nitrososphaera sp.]
MVFATLCSGSTKVALNGMESMAGYVMGKEITRTNQAAVPCVLLWGYQPTNQYGWGLHNCKKPQE